MNRLIRIIVFALFSVIMTQVTLLHASRSLQEDSLRNLFDEMRNYKDKIDVLNQLVSLSSGNAPEKSLQVARQMESISADNDYVKGMAMGSLHMGRAYAMLGSYDKAFEVLSNAQKYFAQIGDVSGEASALNYMANVLYMGYYYPDALSYFRQCLAIKKQVKDSIGIAIAYSNMGECFLQMEKPDSALYYSLAGLGIEQALGNEHGIAVSQSSVASIMIKQNKFNEAIDYYLITSEVFERLKDDYNLAHNYMELSQIYLLLNKPALAMPYIEQGFELARQMKSVDLELVFLQRYSQYYETLQIPQKSLEYYKLYTGLKDSLHKAESRNKMAELKTIYDVENKEHEIALLNKENALNQTLIVSATIVAGLLLFILLFIFWQYRLKRRLAEILEKKNREIATQQSEILKKNRQLEKLTLDLQEMDELKSRFFANISHEFRTPLTLIIGPLEQLLTRLTNSHESKTLSLAIRNARSLLGLINQLLEISRFEKGMVKLNLQRGSISSQADFVVQMFSSKARGKGVDLSFSSHPDPVIGVFDKEKLENILINLISNAIKNTNKGHIHVRLEVNQGADRFVLSVLDTGQGIAPNELERVFDRFYMGNNTSGEVGTGIGLAFTKEIVGMYNGTIRVESELQRGTTFFVELPLGVGALNADDYKWVDTDMKAGEMTCVDSVEPDEYSGRQNKDGAVRSKDFKTVLLVEDHVELREFIRDNLEGAYHVIEAGNGQEGLNLAYRKYPDIILADVMMAGMDGIEMAKTIKNNPDTSHIPIIMLTAKSSEKSVIEGLETRVDDYITKPFSMRELAVRIRNILSIRQKLQDKYKRSLTVNPSEITSNSIDEQFVAKILKVVEEHIADPEFSVETLCQEATVSRSALHKKLKSLLNQSATEFINTIRVKRAAQLIKQNAGTISEIAYDVGFSNLSYFSKVFRKYLGVSPSDMATR